MPVDHFDIVGNELLRGAVFAQRTFIVFLLNRKVAGIHVVVCALESYESAQLLQWCRTIIHSQIENAILPGLARGSSGDHNQRGRLPAANVATDALRGV